MGPVPVRRRAVPGQSANGGAVSAVVAVRPRTGAGCLRDPTGPARVSGFLLHVSPGETRARRPAPGGGCGRTGVCLRRLRRGPGRPPEPDQRRRLAASRAAGLRPFRDDAPRVLAGSGRARAGDAAPGGPPAGDVHDVDRARHLRRGPRALAQRAAAGLVRGGRGKYVHPGRRAVGCPAAANPRAGAAVDSRRGSQLARRGRRVLAGLSGGARAAAAVLDQRAVHRIPRLRWRDAGGARPAGGATRPLATGAVRRPGELPGGLPGPG